jgi:hypothetical protein
MPFQEYSPEYTHVKHTLGFSGRPSGPDFYINKIDNSIAHGPGGQEHHDLHEEADPCFAKVIAGEQILEDIYKIPVYSRGDGHGNLIVNPVIILNAKVLSSNTNHELFALLNDEQSMQEVERPHDINNNDNNNNEEQQSEIVEQQHQQQVMEQPLQEEVERPNDEHNNNNNNNNNEEQHNTIVDEQQPQQHAVEQALQEELDLSHEQRQQ